MKELNRVWNFIFLVGALDKRRYVTPIFLSFALFTGVFWCTFHWCILVHFSLVYSGALFTSVFWCTFQWCIRFSPLDINYTTFVRNDID